VTTAAGVNDAVLLGTISASSTAQAVVASALEAMRRLGRWDAAVWIATDGKDQRLVGSSGFFRTELCGGGRIPADQGLCPAALRAGRPVVVEDCGTDPLCTPALSPLLDQTGLVSAAAFPFRASDPHAGAIVVYARRRRVVSSCDLDVLAEVARVAAVCHELHATRDRLAGEHAVTEALDAFSADLLRGLRLELALADLSDRLGAEVFVERSPHLPAGPAEPPGGGPPRAARTIRVAGSEAALLKAGDPAVPADDVLERIGLIVGHDIARQREAVETEMRLSEDIVRHLLEGNHTELQEMWYRGSLAGIDLGIARAMVWIAHEQPMDPAMLDRIRREVRLRAPRSHVWAYRGEALAFWAAEEGALAIVRREVSELLRACGSLRLTAGISQVCLSANEHPGAVREARFAAQLALQRGPGSVVAVDELGVYGVFAHIGSIDALRAAVEQSVGALRARDACDRSELVPTLRAYLEHDRRLAQTARCLHLHVNTLRYRLERIGEILEVDLDDPDVRFATLLALRLADVVAAAA
jgi:sugar diacid utilization regulator